MASNNDDAVDVAIRELLTKESSESVRALLLIMQKISNSLDETVRVNRQLEIKILRIATAEEQKRGWKHGIKQAWPIIAVLLCGYQTLAVREYERIIKGSDNIQTRMANAENNIRLIVANSTKKVRDGIAFDRIINTGVDYDGQ